VEERGEKRKKGRIREVYRANFFFPFSLFSSDEKIGTTYPEAPRRFVSGAG
jgi:hypothetical protein